MNAQICTIEHAGSAISDDYIVAYMSRDMKCITTWRGEFIANCKIASSWPIRSWMSDRMYQVYATVNGRRYTGRTLGGGMIVRMRAVRINYRMGI